MLLATALRTRVVRRDRERRVVDRSAGVVEVLRVPLAPPGHDAAQRHGHAIPVVVVDVGIGLAEIRVVGADALLGVLRTDDDPVVDDLDRAALVHRTGAPAVLGVGVKDRDVGRVLAGEVVLVETDVLVGDGAGLGVQGRDLGLRAGRDGRREGLGLVLGVVVVLAADRVRGHDREHQGAREGADEQGQDRAQIELHCIHLPN